MGKYSEVVYDVYGNVSKITNIHDETIAIGDTAEYTFVFSSSIYAFNGGIKKTTGTVKRIRFEENTNVYSVVS